MPTLLFVLLLFLFCRHHSHWSEKVARCGSVLSLQNNNDSKNVNSGSRTNNKSFCHLFALYLLDDLFIYIGFGSGRTVCAFMACRPGSLTRYLVGTLRCPKFPPPAPLFKFRTPLASTARAIWEQILVLANIPSISNRDSYGSVNNKRSSRDNNKQMNSGQNRQKITPCIYSAAARQQTNKMRAKMQRRQKIQPYSHHHKHHRYTHHIRTCFWISPLWRLFAYRFNVIADSVS